MGTAQGPCLLCPTNKRSGPPRAAKKDALHGRRLAPAVRVPAPACGPEQHPPPCTRWGNGRGEGSSGTRRENPISAVPGKDQSRGTRNPSGLERTLGPWSGIRHKGFSTLSGFLKDPRGTEGRRKRQPVVKLSESDRRRPAGPRRLSPASHGSGGAPCLTPAREASPCPILLLSGGQLVTCSGEELSTERCFSPDNLKEAWPGGLLTRRMGWTVESRFKRDRRYYVNTGEVTGSTSGL